MNLLKCSSLQDKAIDFSTLKRGSFVSQLKEALTLAQKKLNTLLANSEEPSFENTIVALNSATDELSQVSQVFHALKAADGDKVIHDQAEEFSQLSSEFSTNLYTNVDLFKKIESVYKNRQALNGEDRRLCERLYKDFVNSGVHLGPEKKKKFKELRKQLSSLTTRFAQNLLKETTAFELHITDEAELAGLPQRLLNAAKETAESKGKSGFLFLLDMPTYIDFMENCENRKLREQYYKARSGLCVTGERSNQDIILQVVRARQQLAEILGHKNYATYALKERMAKSPENVWTFLKELKDKCLEKGHQDVKAVEEFAVKSGLKDVLRPWDFLFYTNKMKIQNFDFDEEELRPYFSLDKVLGGLFKVAEKLYGLSFVQNHSLPKYHKETSIYEVYKKDKYYGLLYLDLFPRSTKGAGAWHTVFRSQGTSFGEVCRPHAKIVCNFTKPTKEAPSLLSFQEVETLFHEFGHALHSLLSQCTHSYLSGTSVDLDFVEFPSQIMENWANSEEVLQDFAFHYKTQEPLPKELLLKLKKSRVFMAGYQFLRQINLSLLDMHWHCAEATKATDVLQFENEVTKETAAFEPVQGCCTSTSFGHIFCGGYSAGYYSYKWAEVLEADAFELFKQKGLFNPEVASRLEECVLSQGNRDAPDKLYENFRGAPPKVDPLIRKYELDS